MKKTDQSVIETETDPDEKESTGAAFFYGILFWTIAGSIIAWFVAPEAGKIKVIRIGGLIIGIILLIGALTIWPKRKHFVLEMSAVALIASFVLWQDNERVWAMAIALIVFGTDLFLIMKGICEAWLNSYDDDNRTERGP